MKRILTKKILEFEYIPKFLRDVRASKHWSEMKKLSDYYYWRIQIFPQYQLNFDGYNFHCYHNSIDDTWDIYYFDFPPSEKNEAIFGAVFYNKSTHEHYYVVLTKTWNVKSWNILYFNGELFELLATSESLFDEFDGCIPQRGEKNEHLSNRIKAIFAFLARTVESLNQTQKTGINSNVIEEAYQQWFRQYVEKLILSRMECAVTAPPE